VLDQVSFPFAGEPKQWSVDWMTGASVFKGVEADLLFTGEMSHVRSFISYSLIP